MEKFWRNLFSVSNLIPEECHADAPDDPVESVVDNQELEGGAWEPTHGEGQDQHQGLNSFSEDLGYQSLGHHSVSLLKCVVACRG